MTDVPITPVQAAEFRGLFFGEGHLDLVRQSRLLSLHPRARIALRDDDEAVLHWCRDLFGGNLSRSAATRSVCWQATGRDRIGAILAVLEGGHIPSKKRREVAVMRKAHGLIGPRGNWIKPEVQCRLVELRDELKALRIYKEADQCPASAV